MQRFMLVNQARVLMIGIAVLVLALASTACILNDDKLQRGSEADTVIALSGARPNWGVEDMVKRVDAVVIGTVKRELALKQAPGGDDDPPLFYHQYKDYEVSVEEAIYPKAGLPENIAILVEAGAVASDSSIAIHGNDDVPSFFTEEKSLVFLESLKGDKFSEGVGRPVPKGFTEDSYFQVIIGAGLGKLLPEGDKWEDSRTGEVITLDDIRDALENKDSDESIGKEDK